MEPIKQHDLAHFNVSVGEEESVPISTTGVATTGVNQEFSLYVQYASYEICKNVHKMLTKIEGVFASCFTDYFIPR